jgi:hypothetical protein
MVDTEVIQKVLKNFSNDAIQLAVKIKLNKSEIEQINGAFRTLLDVLNSGISEAKCKKPKRKTKRSSLPSDQVSLSL